MRTSKACMLLIALFCLALQVQPQSITVQGGAGTAFDQVFTITNDAQHPINVDIQPHPFSTYLADAATLSATGFTLSAHESRNVQVRGTVPLLGPETHELTYTANSEADEPAAFTIRIPIPGSATLKPGIEVSVDDVVRDEPVSASVRMRNFGNVVAYYNLTLLIEQNGGSVGRLTYPRLEQVLPGEEQVLGLLYTDRLEPGEYTVRVRARVNQEQDTEAVAPMRVLLEDQARTIQTGEDLELSFTGSAPTSTVEYVVLQDGKEVLRDTQVHRDGPLVVPTGGLSPGEYQVRATVSHDQGSDVTRLDLTIKPRRILSWWVFIAVIIVGGVLSLTARYVRLGLRMRIWLAERQVSEAEKQLNALIRRAHELTR